MADTPIPLNNRGFRPSWVMAQKLEGCYDNGILEAKALSLDGLPHYPSAKYQVWGSASLRTTPTCFSL